MTLQCPNCGEQYIEGDRVCDCGETLTKPTPMEIELRQREDSDESGSGEYGRFFNERT